uniref:Uncharacterized protein n=1 Tax=viral metagenome TaxID=1070528 RepID=A0A6M3KYJ4_9ZZZZ
MSLAKGVKHGRKAIIQQHRLTVFLRAFDRYCNGEVPAEYVAERRNKLKEIEGRVSKR